MSREVQFELFPEKRYGILLHTGGLAHDIHAQAPALYKTREAARRAMGRMPSYMKETSEIRPVEIHGDPYGHGTFVVGSRKRSTRHKRSR